MTARALVNLAGKARHTESDFRPLRGRKRRSIIFLLYVLSNSSPAGLLACLFVLASRPSPALHFCICSHPVCWRNPARRDVYVHPRKENRSLIALLPQKHSSDTTRVSEAQDASSFLDLRSYMGLSCGRCHWACRLLGGRWRAHHGCSSGRRCRCSDFRCRRCCWPMHDARTDCSRLTNHAVDRCMIVRFDIAVEGNGSSCSSLGPCSTKRCVAAALRSARH